MLQELDGLLGEEIDRVAGEAVAVVVVDDLVVVKAGGVAVGKSHPMIEGQLRDKGDAQVELADQGGGVSRVLDDGRQVGMNSAMADQFWGH